MFGLLIRTFSLKCVSSNALKGRSYFASLTLKSQYSAVCNSCQLNRLNSIMRGYSTGKGGFEDLDKPIKFTTSKAAEWKATDTHGGSHNDMPDCQPLVVSLSVGAFLLYFLYLREENDIDEGMKQPLWDRVPGLERQQLEMLMKYNAEHNISTKDIQERLEVVRRQDAEMMRKEATK